MALRQFPELPRDRLAVHRNIFVFHFSSFITLSVDTGEFRLALERTHPQQRQRLVTGISKVVKAAHRQHDRLALDKHGRLMGFVIERRLAVQYDKSVILTKMCMEFVFTPNCIIVNSDGHQFRVGERNMAPATGDHWGFELISKRVHDVVLLTRLNLACSSYIAVTSA